MSESGYSGTPLPRKLGLKPEFAALFVALPEDLRELADHIPQARCVDALSRADGSDLDYLHVFETARAALEDRASGLRAMLRPAGMLWISWPKKAAKMPTTITEDGLRSIFLPIGLVDVKVCAVNEIRSGLKFVIRKELRR